MAVLLLPGRGAKGLRPAPFPPTVNRQSPQRTNLLLWWAGSTIFPVNAVGAVGTYPGVLPISRPVGIGGIAPFFSNGASLEAVSVGGSSTSALALNTLPMTVAGWAYMSSIGVNNNNNTIVSVGTAATQYSYYISTGGGHLNAYNITLGNFLDGSITIPASVWFHWAVTFATSDMRLYVNGKADNTSGTCGVNALADTVYIGDRVDNVSQSFAGAIADVRWYRGVLTPFQIADLARNPWDLYTAPGRRMFIDAVSAVATRLNYLPFLGVS